MFFETAEILYIFLKDCDLIVRRIEMWDIMKMAYLFGNGPDEIVLYIKDFYMVLLINFWKMLQLIHAYL